MKFSFTSALHQECPLQIVGVIHAYSALLAKKAGFKAIYLSGAGIANGLGLPDLGMTTLSEVSEEIRKITARVSLPLLVDGDTGFGSTLNIQRMVQEFILAGAKAVHIEDQVFPKRCGHREGKTLVSITEMKDRLKAALDARSTSDFCIVARTDAPHVETIEQSIERALAYQETGVDLIFVEALKSIEDYKTFSSHLTLPILANITEFGKTPLLTVDELQKAGVQAILYPLSAFRAMNKAALDVFTAIRTQGSQASVLDKMQTREELYQILDYYKYEEKL